MLENYLVQTCYLVTTTRNEYGDFIDSSKVAMACRFREINTIRRVSHGEVDDTSAQIWLSPMQPVDKASIIEFEGATYEIQKITKARRLGEDIIQFLKCDLKVLTIAIS